MKTHIIEQREDGICFPVEEVYLVNETKQIIGEEDDMMKNETIYVFTDKEEAIEEARGLNKLYGESCIFSDDGDFEAVNYDECYTNDLHYFEVVTMKINKGENR